VDPQPQRHQRPVPEIAAATSRQLPDGVVLDGELVILGADGRLSFDALQQRLVTSPAKARAKAAELLASYQSAPPRSPANSGGTASPHSPPATPLAASPRNSYLSPSSLICSTSTSPPPSAGPRQTKTDWTHLHRRTMT
jgi:hypothetical protein